MLWELDLGAVISARATLLHQPAGTAAAYVGTHAGRFVGVAVEGDDAGQLVLDLDLGGIVWATALADDEGRLFVGADNDMFFGIDPSAGEIMWSVRIGDCDPPRAPGPEGVRCDPDGGPTLGPDGDLYLGADGVYRIARDGQIRWHWSTVTESEADTARKPAGSRHVFSTPAVTREAMIVFGGQDGFVTALSSDGQEQWRHRVGADVDGSPAIGSDGTIYIGADDGGVYALHPDGRLRWRFKTQREIRSGIAVAEDGMLYVTSFDGNLYSLDPEGNLRWVLPTGAPIASSPVIDGAGTIFFGGQDDRLYAVRPSGSVSWVLDFPANIDSSVSVTASGTLVVGSDDGYLRALR